MIASEQFYLQEAVKGGGRALELGCGSGRLTLLIAQNGIDIVGADLSSSMLDAARAKAAAAKVDVPFVQADMRHFDLAGKFSTILIPGNSLLHLLTIDELKQCLASVRRHLEPGGRLVFDISNWDMSRFTRDPEQRCHALAVGEITVEETTTTMRRRRSVTWFGTFRPRVHPISAPSNIGCGLFFRRNFCCCWSVPAFGWKPATASLRVSRLRRPVPGRCVSARCRC
jgi:SAM-dependent methyltransferase